MGRRTAARCRPHPQELCSPSSARSRPRPGDRDRSRRLPLRAAPDAVDASAVERLAGGRDQPRRRPAAGGRASAACRLGVRVADADLDLVAAVGAPGEPDEDVFDQVAALVDRSLLDVRPSVRDGGVRYQQLRPYGAMRCPSSRPTSGRPPRRRTPVPCSSGRRSWRPGSPVRTGRTSWPPWIDSCRTSGRRCGTRCRRPGTLPPGSGSQPPSLTTGSGAARRKGWSGCRTCWRRRRLAHALGPMRCSGCAPGLLDHRLPAREAAGRPRALGIRRLGDALGAGRALRRLGAIAAAADDVAARSYFEQSLSRLGRRQRARHRYDVAASRFAPGRRVAGCRKRTDAASRPGHRAAGGRSAGRGPRARGADAVTVACRRPGRGGPPSGSARSRRSARSASTDGGHRRLPARGGLPRAGSTGRSTPLRSGRAGGEPAFGHPYDGVGQRDLARLDLEAGDTRAASANISVGLAELEPTADRWF